MVFIILSIAWSLLLNAQIFLENEYETSFFFSFKVTKLIDSKTKYYLVINDTLKIFNLNHTMYKQIPIPQQFNQDDYSVYCVSDKLFDIDSKVEYLLDYVSIYTGKVPGGVKVFNEEGMELFSADDYHIFIAYFDENPILSTENGVKMILGGWVDNKVRIYSLPGFLPDNIKENANSPIIFGLSDSYPNPSKEYTRINYRLPRGINDGEIVFFTLNGMELKRFRVDRTSDYLIVTTDDLPTGTYLYHLQTRSGISEGKKMIVIH